MAKIALTKESGIVGVPEWDGRSTERYLEELQGPDGIKIMAQILRREPAAFTVNHSILMTARNTTWKITPATDKPADRKSADFIASCFNDMSHDPWTAFSFALSCMAFGFADLEIVWKRRQGQTPRKSQPSSKFSDNLIGLRKLAVRRQETIKTWTEDDNGGKQAMIQIDPEDESELPPIPIEKLLHFVGGDDRGSWEGLGWLEPAYSLAQMIRNYEIILGIGHQRSHVGLPIIGYKSAPSEQDRTMARRIARNLLVNAQQYVEYPESTVSFRLETVGNSNAGELRLLINQLRWEMMSLALIQFFRLGTTNSGSRALADPMVKLFQSGVDSALASIGNVFNRHLIPRLLALNPTMMPSDAEYPQLTFSPVQPLSPEILRYLTTIQQFIDTSAVEDGHWLREILGMPEIDLSQRPRKAVQDTQVNNQVDVQVNEQVDNQADNQVDEAAADTETAQ